NISTTTRPTLRTFEGYDTITFGGGEADISEDGNYITIVGDFAADHMSGVVHTYHIGTDTLSSGFSFSGHELDWCDMTPDNNVLCMWNSNGDGRYEGIELFDSGMAFQRQITNFYGHADRGRDTNGDEIVVLVASNDGSPASGCSGNGIEK